MELSDKVNRFSKYFQRVKNKYLSILKGKIKENVK